MDLFQDSHTIFNQRWHHAYNFLLTFTNEHLLTHICMNMYILFPYEHPHHLVSCQHYTCPCFLFFPIQIEDAGFVIDINIEHTHIMTTYLSDFLSPYWNTSPVRRTLEISESWGAKFSDFSETFAG